MTDFRMPSLGSDMEAGTLVEWLKGPGDTVKRGDIVAVVETQKGAIEIEIFEDGTIEELLVPVGETVPVGTSLARLKRTGRAAAPAAAMPPAAAALSPPLPVEPPSAPPAPEGEGPRASPAARRLAKERGIDIAKLAGSGSGGAVVLADVEAAAATTQKTRPRGLDLDEMRKAIAAAMSRSKREIPHYYLSHDIDLGAATDWLAETNAVRVPEQRLLIGVLLLKAVALALTRHEGFNGFYGKEGFTPGAAVHVGAAVSIRGGGLVAPAIHDAEKLDLDSLMAKLRDLVARARTGMLRSSELADPTVTVSSLGERGVAGMYSIIYPPQVAIFGIGKVVERPWPVAGQVALRPVVTVTLAGDHRVSDGHRGALVLNEIDRLLQEPDKL